MKLLFITGCVILFFTSLFCLDGRPRIWIDEGIYLHIGRTIAEQGVFGFQVAPNIFEDISLISVGYPLLYPLSLIIRFFGANIFTARFLMIFFIAAFSFTFYFLTRQLYGKKAAVWSFLLLVSFAPLYGNGKSVLGEVPGLFFLTLGLLFFHLCESSTSRLRRYALAAGICFGLSISTKPAFILLFPALFIACSSRFRFWLAHYREIIILGIGLIIPLLVWIATQFQGNYSIGRILSHYGNPYAIENISSLAVNNIIRFFTESTPLHFMILFITSIIFLMYTHKARERITSTEIFLFVFIVLIMIWYVRTPGWYRYFFPAHVFLFIFFPAFCFKMRDVCTQRFKVVCLLGVAQIVLFFVQLQHLALDWRSCPESGVDDVKKYLVSAPSDASILFYNTPELAFLNPSQNFSQFLHITRSIDMGKDAIAKIARGDYTLLSVPTSDYKNGVFSGTCYGEVLPMGNYTFLKKQNDKKCGSPSVYEKL